MKINWKIRIKNKLFWLAIIPMLFLLVQQVFAIFGIAFDYANLQDRVLAIVGTIFAILGALGIVTDHTTEGLNDTEKVMTYTEPREENPEYEEFEEGEY